MISDELYEILSSLPESVVYSCRPCSVTQPSAWRELLYIELRSGVEKVLACLLSSTLTQHLVTCSQVGDMAFSFVNQMYHVTNKTSISLNAFTRMCYCLLECMYIYASTIVACKICFGFCCSVRS